MLFFRTLSVQLSQSVRSSQAVQLAQSVDKNDMMDDGQSLTLFVVVVVALSVLVALGLPIFMGRLSLRRSVPVLALVGPVLAIVGALVGTGAMTLSGHDAGYVLTVTILSGVAAIIVGWRLARPLANDLDRVATTVSAIAAGERSARTDIDRQDELGVLASAVDELGRSLVRVEAERSAADDERQSVVSALSHDLRTPLASLLVSIDAIEDGIAEVDEHLPAMRQNVLALNRLVEDLFLLARADSGNLALQSESLDLAELVDEALEAMGPTAAGDDVGLQAVLDQAVPVRGDATAIGRVLRNLVDNAIRHSPEGGRVVVAVEVEDGSAIVQVRDDGPGFDAEFLPRAFERFSQHDPARSRHGGAGLGLAIAQTLIQAHGGSVTIEAGPGGRVQLCLPLDSPVESVRARRCTASSNRSGSPLE